MTNPIKSTAYKVDKLHKGAILYITLRAKGKAMRSYKIFGIKDGGAEEWVTTVSNAADGKQAHQDMKQQGYFDYIRCRDVLGGLRFEYNLKTGRKTG